MGKYTKLCAKFVSQNQPDYSGLGIDNTNPEYDDSDIYVDLSCISHFHETEDKNINIFILGEKWTIKGDINEFEKLMNSK